MSGHSKWSTIKRDKAVNDSKRSQIFTKVSRLITNAAKKSGKDPDSNPSLRLAIEKAKEARMPKDNIQKAIDKAFGGGSGAALEEVTYEGYGPDGVAILIKALTDNKNRTVSEIRNIFARYGGSLGEAGCAGYIFNADPENPVYEVPFKSESDASKILELLSALDDNDDVQDVYSNFTIVGEGS